MTLINLINTANTILKKKRKIKKTIFMSAVRRSFFFLSHCITELHASDIEIRAVIEIIA